MSSEQPSKPLPADDSIVVKLINTEVIHGNNRLFHAGTNSPLHVSAKELVDKVATVVRHQIQPQRLFEQGIKVEILEPEKKWITGNIRLRFVFEFVPDESENKTPSGFVSPLDDIRNMNT